MNPLYTEYLQPIDKRIMLVTGHYGSGKTEFSVSLALLLKPLLPADEKLSLVDIDIANPYFRSRERRRELGAAGINIYGSAYKDEITAELPALGADIRTPLEDQGCRVIVDVGGNDSGARVLHQFRKYLNNDTSMVTAVINANRPETRDLIGALAHMSAIEQETGLTIEYIINNCHLLRETNAETVKKGAVLCEQLCNETGKKLLCHCYPAQLVAKEQLRELDAPLMPMGLHMRQTWLDK